MNRNSYILPKLNDDGSLYQTTLKVNGKSFRCECLCNVFHVPDKTNPEHYKCNACGAEYLGEKEQQ